MKIPTRVYYIGMGLLAAVLSVIALGVIYDTFGFIGLLVGIGSFGFAALGICRRFLTF